MVSMQLAVDKKMESVLRRQTIDYGREKRERQSYLRITRYELRLNDLSIKEFGNFTAKTQRTQREY